MNIKHCPGSKIPEGEHLFRYFNPIIIPEGQIDIPVAIFKDKELSCDWEYYKKNPFSSFHIEEGCSRVIQITVCEEIINIRNPRGKGEIVEAWHQDIIYSPISQEQDEKHGENPAHSLIIGKKRDVVCNALKEHSKEVFESDFVNKEILFLKKETINKQIKKIIMPLKQLTIAFFQSIKKITCLLVRQYNKNH